MRTETTLVFSSLIETINSVSCMKNLMFNKTFSENPKSQSKTYKTISEWSRLRLMNSRGRLSSGNKNYLPYQNWPKNYWNFKSISSKPIKSKTNYPLNCKTRLTKTGGDNFQAKTPTKKPSMPKSVF